MKKKYEANFYFDTLQKAQYKMLDAITRNTGVDKDCLFIGFWMYGYNFSAEVCERCAWCKNHSGTSYEYKIMEV